MPDFDLAQPHKAEYHFSALPNIGKHCGVYLAFHDPQDKFHAHDGLGAAVEIELLNTEGGVVVSVAGNLGAFIWYGTGDLHGLYKMDESFFSPDTNAQYRLRITYTPDPRLEGFRGFIYLLCGGNL
jgi:hypothetical protein